MVHHQLDLILRKIPERCSLRQDTPYKLVCDLYTALLVRPLGITVEHIGSAITLLVKFNRCRISKFTSTVR